MRNIKIKLSRDNKADILALFVCLILALAFRLPGLTVFLTADEPRSWYGRAIIFLDSLTRGDLANTGPGGTVPFIENVSLSPAPGVTTMWTGALGILLEYWRQGADQSLAQFLRAIPFDPVDPTILFSLRLPGVLISVLAVGLTYWWSRRLLGRWGALLAAALIALDPFYLALSRVLGHDAMATTFMWLSLLAFLRVAATQASDTTSNRTFLILSGALAGLAVLSKYPALFIGAFIALALLFVYLRQAPISRIADTLLRWVRDMALWSAAAAVVFVLFWPAMWVNPLGPVTAIINDALRVAGSAHQKGSFFLGQPVPDPGPAFYPMIVLLRSTPLNLLGLLASLMLLVWPRLGREITDSRSEDDQSWASASTTPRTQYTVLLILLAYVILYTLLITYGGKKQDRYLLPAFPALAMLAAVGFILISRFRIPGSHHNFQLSRFKWLLLGGIVLLQIALVIPTYPYYFSFYNPLAGGSVAAAHLVQVGWGEGLDRAAAYLNTLPGVESAKVTSWYSTTFEPYFKGQAIYKIEDEKISRSAKPGLTADYVVFYINQTQRRLPSEGVLAYFQQEKPIHTVSLNGQDYAWIYAAPGISHIITREARLVGQAELLGFELTDEAGQALTAVYPESVAQFSLFWEWQGKSDDDPIRISLVDDDGVTRGWGNPIETVAPLPYSEWQEGMIVRDDFALVIFVDTLPGEYRLTAWIERPSTDETVGVFPLEDEIMIQVVPRQPE